MKRYMAAGCGVLGLALGFGFVRSASANIVNGFGTIDGFGDFSGFTISQTDAGPAPTTGSGAIQITTNSANDSRTVTFNTQVDISQYSASWGFGATNIQEPQNGSAFDMEKFSLTTATGHIDVIFQSAGVSGYGTEVDWANQSTPLFHDFIASKEMPIGITTQGAFPHIIVVPITQTAFTGSGSIYTSNITGSGNPSIFNLPAIQGILGAGPATLSFSATTDGLGANQNISNFEFSNVPEPCSAALMVLGAGLGMRRNRRRG
jgi:hypothetical protein